MNRETESHFSTLPNISIKRSSFKRPNRHLTSFNTGDVIPIYVDSDIMPGDTVKMEMGEIVRMTTPIFPVMDNAYLDIYFFFVPHRLVWDHWREFWGENRTTHWETPIEYTIPQIVAPSGGWTQGTIADYMGIPIGIDNISVNHLPFRAYCQIMNDWFVDENLKDPCNYTKDETTVTGANSGSYVTYTEAGAKPFKAAKFHDYFTSALPNSQKHSPVMVPLGSVAPVIIGDTNIGQKVSAGMGMTWAYSNGNSVATDGLIQASTTSGTETTTGIGTSGAAIHPDNLYADLSQAVGASINTFRQALALQSFYEAQARGGTRYIEIIKSIFGVTSPDGRQQRAEYLGGNRININMDQVLQTSSTDAVSPQGNTAAFSCTVDSGEVFTSSFTEHGTLMGLAVVRTDHTYQQGIDRMWSRTKQMDYYVPQLAQLGEQAILNKEIYAQGTNKDNEVFGYQECWAEYRYRQNLCSSTMRSTATGSLDSWHYGDDYNALPTLSAGWIDEPVENMDRTLTVQSSNADQFFGDFYFNATYVRPMPVYSTPATLTHY